MCAAAQVSPLVTDEESTARSSWASAPLVLACADLAASVASWRLPVRQGVLVVTDDDEDESTLVPALRAAVDVRADGVVALPSGATALVSRVADLADGEVAATTVGVVGGSGGAGASTLAVGLSLRAARKGHDVLLVDADRAGPGLELVAGCERAEGLRWGDIGASSTLRGRLRGTSLRAALPVVDALAVLSWRGDARVPLVRGVTEAVVGPARRGCDLVVVDLPRRLDDAAREALGCCSALFVVCLPDVRAVTSTRMVLDGLMQGPAAVSVVVRWLPGARVSPDVVGDALGLRVAGVVPTRRAVTRAVDDGVGPIAGWGMARALDSLLSNGCGIGAAPRGGRVDR